MTNSTHLIATQVPGLDTVLGGGLRPGSLVFVLGPAGAGKTVLASQILFAGARRGSRCLIFSAFSEGHEKLTAHLQTFSFYDHGLLARQFTLLPLPSVIGDDIEAAGLEVSKTIREAGAHLVLIDGFQGIAGLIGNPTTVRRLLATLSTLALYLGVTLLVTLEGSGRDPAIGAQVTAADVVVGLEYTVAGWRHVRRLEVIKQRGHAPLPGLHSYRLSTDGLTVAPRLEALPRPPARPHATSRVAFGLPELDAVLGGGLPAGSVTFLAGAPGAGKTVLGLAWAQAAVQAGTQTVFLGFGEQPTQLRETAAAFGFPLDAALTTGALHMLHIVPVELDPDMVATRLLAALTPTTQRVVIDEIASLMVELGPRARDYLAALRTYLDNAGVTSLWLHEIEPFAGFQLNLTASPLTRLADNVLLLQQQWVQGTQHRVLATVKMRAGSAERTLRELVLEPGGIRVLAPDESAAGLLQAIVDQRGGTAPAAG